MTTLTPYLLFDGNCAGAMAFYQKCLGGTLSMTTVHDTPMKEHFPQNQHQKVVYARLTNGTIDLSASDWLHLTRTRQQGNATCLYINGSEYEEIKSFFVNLSEEADHGLLDPLQDMPFGTYGALTDKYGVRWMFRVER